MVWDGAQDKPRASCGASTIALRCGRTSSRSHLGSCTLILAHVSFSPPFPTLGFSALGWHILTLSPRQRWGELCELSVLQCSSFLPATAGGPQGLRRLNPHRRVLRSEESLQATWLQINYTSSAMFPSWGAASQKSVKLQSIAWVCGGMPGHTGN